MPELRCDSKILHGVTDGVHIEVVCRSNRCGKAPGVVVLHKFNVATGQLVSTQRLKEVSSNGARQ